MEFALYEDEIYILRSDRQVGRGGHSYLVSAPCLSFHLLMNDPLTCPVYQA